MKHHTYCTELGEKGGRSLLTGHTRKGRILRAVDLLEGTTDFGVREIA